MSDEQPSNHLQALYALPRDVVLIACDWNGTLVADAERAHRATNDVLFQSGLPELTLSAFRDAFVLPLPHFFAALGVEAGRLSWAETLWNQRMAAEPAVLAPGAQALLDAARVAGIPIGLVSASETRVVEGDARALGVRDKLTFVIGGAHPKREALAELTKTTTGAVLYLGDTEYDLHEAIAVGAIPIGVSWGYRPPAALHAAGAMAILTDLSDLCPVILTTVRRAKGLTTSGS